MSARTRRSIVFSWTVLFVLSLVMQYASFAAAPPALGADPVLVVTSQQDPSLAGNPTCVSFKDTYGGGQPWQESKRDPASNGTVNVAGFGTITVSNFDNEGSEKGFTWTSTFGIDAVFLKTGVGGGGYNSLYVYAPTAASPEATSGSAVTGSPTGISHISFCYDASPALEITKTAGAAKVDAGQPISFTITVKSTGQATANGVTLTDSLPGGAGIDWSENSADCSISGTPPTETLNCSFGNMAAGTQKSVTVTSQTTANSCGEHPNTATAQATNHAAVQASAKTEVLCAEIEVEKTADAATVDAGQPIGFTVTLSNNGSGTATGVAFTDNLPGGPGISWSISPASAGWSITGAAPNQQLVYSPTILAGKTSTSVHVVSDTTAASCGEYDNTASVTTANDGSDSASASTEVLCAEIEVEKSGNGPLSAGQTATFTITVWSHGPGTASDVSLTDQLPSGGWTLGGANAAACSIDGSNLLTCDFGDLAAGASRTFTVTRTTSADDCGTIHNEVTVSATNEPAEDVEPNTDDADIVVNCPDLVVDKDGKGGVSAGEVARFEISVTNLGPGTAFDVTLSDQLPSGDWTLGGPDAADCSIDASNLLTCDFGDLADGESREIELSRETVADDCGRVRNTATVAASNESQDDLENNEDDGNVVVACADITITKTGDAASVNAGDPIGFTITVTNTGDGSAFGVTVSDTLPTDTGLNWVIDGGANAADCEISGGVLSCDFGTLASGTSKAVHISSPTTAATCGVVDNSASVTTTNDGSGQDDSMVEVLCAEIDVEKVADDDDVVAGDPIGFTITVRNLGDGTAYGVEVVDELPADLAWSIDGAANGFSIVSGDLVFGPADLAGGASVSVHIVASTDAEDCGRIDNTASVTTSNDGSDEDSDSVMVRCPGVDIDKGHDDDDGVVGHGQTVTYTIELTVVDGAVTQAVVSDKLPAGQTYVGGSQATLPAADDFEVSADGRTLTWTWNSLADGALITYDVTIDADASTGDQTNVAEICVAELDECEDDDATVTVPELTIDKSFTGNTGGEGPGGIPEAKVGDVLTYTLAYDVTNGPVHNGVITDVLPVGLAYVEGSATGNAEFSFTSFDAATRTLRWDAPVVAFDGSVTYEVLVLTGADELPQPLVNVATIDSDETDEDDDEEQVFVETPPLAVTSPPKVTLPPTNTVQGPDHGTSSPGTTLLLVLIGLAGFVLAVGFMTPAPARARRRGRR